MKTKGIKKYLFFIVLIIVAAALIGGYFLWLNSWQNRPRPMIHEGAASIRLRDLLDIDEKELIIPKSDKSFSIQDEINKEKNIDIDLGINLNKTMIENNKKNSMFNNNNLSFSQLKDNKTKPHSKNNSPKTEKKTIKISFN